jgi:hypothetical protein
MINGFWFVVAIMLLQAGAALAYAWDGEHWKATLWLGVLIANIGVLGGMR